ncbi:MAG: GNAT family N-acetyltransferase [Pseudomonadota bacterium]
MTATAIRLANTNDIEQVTALFDAYRQFYSQPADIVLSRQFIADRMRKGESVILVAESDAAVTGTSGLTGFCQLYPGFCSVLAQPIYTLYDLFVAPEARNTGAGRALLVAAHEHARANGFSRLDLSTARSNHAAQALYESLGWQRDEVYFSYSKTLP